MKYLEKFNNYDFLRVVCIGDSTTSQDWCHPNWIDWLSYTFRESGDWQRAWKRQVINAGRDGANAIDILEYFDETITINKPDVVIFSVGLNQLLPFFDAEKAEREIELLFKTLSKHGIETIAWPPYAIPKENFSKDLKNIRQTYEKLSKKYNAKFVDIHNEFLNYDLTKLFTFTNNENAEWEIGESEPDYLHCNVAGNQIIAEKIAREAFEIDLLEWQFGTMKLLDLNELKK